MIKASTLNLYSLPSLPLANRSQLPAKAGIYFVLDEYKTPLYIGRSNNIKHRWLGHHKLPSLQNVSKVIYIAWLEFPDLSLLPQIEQALIEWFNPILNVVKIESVNSISKGKLRNTIKKFVDGQGLTAYAFWKKAGIAQGTAYSLYNNPDQVPNSSVISKICDAFEIQPSEILRWEKGTNANTEE